MGTKASLHLPMHLKADNTTLSDINLASRHHLRSRPWNHRKHWSKRELSVRCNAVIEQPRQTKTFPYCRAGGSSYYGDTLDRRRIWDKHCLHCLAHRLIFTLLLAPMHLTALGKGGLFVGQTYINAIAFVLHSFWHLEISRALFECT